MAQGRYPESVIERTSIRLTAVYEPDEQGWISARVLELPGANTCARTMEDARTMLADAVREFLASYAVEPAPGTTIEPLDVGLN